MEGLDIHEHGKIKVEIVVAKVPVELLIETARKVLYTGHIGDGKIFVYDVMHVVKIRTGADRFPDCNFESDTQTEIVVD